MPESTDQAPRTAALTLVRLVVDELLSPVQAARALRDLGLAAGLDEPANVVMDAAEQLLKKTRLLGDVDSLWLYLEPFELEHVPAYGLAEIADSEADRADAELEQALALLTQSEATGGMTRRRIDPLRRHLILEHGFDGVILDRLLDGGDTYETLHDHQHRANQAGAFGDHRHDDEQQVS